MNENFSPHLVFPCPPQLRRFFRLQADTYLYCPFLILQHHSARMVLLHTVDKL